MMLVNIGLMLIAFTLPGTHSLECPTASAEINVARLPGVRCASSTPFSALYQCSKAYDGSIRIDADEFATRGIGAGAWIEIVFPQRVQFTRVVIWSRCYICDQFSEIVFQSSSQDSLTVNRQCSGDYIGNNCGNQKADEYDLSGLAPSSLLKIIGFKQCAQCAYGSAHNGGFREIEVFGLKTTTNDLNVARLPGVSCISSTPYSALYQCSKAFDGSIRIDADEFATRGIGAGAWIEIVFPQEVQFTRVVIWSRCYICDQFSEIIFRSSSQDSLTVHRQCNGNFIGNNCGTQKADEFDLSALAPSSSLKITGFKGCTQCAPGHAQNGGFREIEVFGVGIETMNLARLPGTTCTASSEYSHEYRCELAFDESNRNIYNEWSSRGQNNGAWVQINFPDTVKFLGAEVWSRCHNCDQFQKIVFQSIPTSTVAVIRSCTGDFYGNVCGNQKGEEYALRSLIPNKSLKIIGYNGCTHCRIPYNNGGFREVRVFGYRLCN